MAEGKITASGVVKAAKIAAGLGLGSPDQLKKPEGGTGRPKLTPAQAARVARGLDPGPDAPGYKRTVVKGGRDAAEFLGARAGTPLGQGEEGQPVEPELPPREVEEARERRERHTVDWSKIDEQREGRRIVDELDELRERAGKLIRTEAELEAARQRRKRRRP